MANTQINNSFESKSNSFKELLHSSKIGKDESSQSLIGGFSQTFAIGLNPETGTGEANNCLGSNCSQSCGFFPPDSPLGSNTGCNSGC